MEGQLANQLATIHSRIAAAARRAGRGAESVMLIAISKTQSVAAMRSAYDAGVRHFGENYAQELCTKAPQLPADITWHCVGHLQRNKVKAVLPHVAWMHSLDSERLAAEIQQRATAPLRCLIEINIAGESTKHGVAPDALVPLLTALAKYPRVQVCGLMGMPPPATNTALSRPAFRRLAQLLAQANTAACYPTPLTELSMGMSDDFEVAIEEGATMVRVGRAIFGERH